MEVVMSGVEAEYEDFLSWLGIPPHFHKVEIGFVGRHLLIIITSEGFPFFCADLPEQKRIDILQEMEFQ